MKFFPFWLRKRVKQISTNKNIRRMNLKVTVIIPLRIAHFLDRGSLKARKQNKRKKRQRSMNIWVRSRLWKSSTTLLLRYSVSGEPIFFEEILDNLWAQKSRSIEKAIPKVTHLKFQHLRSLNSTKTRSSICQALLIMDNKS